LCFVCVLRAFSYSWHPRARPARARLASRCSSISRRRGTPRGGRSSSLHYLFRADRARIVVRAGTRAVRPRRRRWRLRALVADARRPCQALRSMVPLARSLSDHLSAGTRTRRGRAHVHPKPPVEVTPEALSSRCRSPCRGRPNSSRTPSVLACDLPSRHLAAAPISAMLFNVLVSVGSVRGLYTPPRSGSQRSSSRIFSVGSWSIGAQIPPRRVLLVPSRPPWPRGSHGRLQHRRPLSYSLFEVSRLGGLAYFANTNFNDWFAGTSPGRVLAGAAVLIIVLCYVRLGA